MMKAAIYRKHLGFKEVLLKMIVAKDKKGDTCT